jgi:LacI family transcriptional regulator
VTVVNKSGSTQIKEIAKRLDISPGTVSIVLNGRGDAMRISKATQQRVRDAAKEMNYQPNIYARRLRSSGTVEACKIIAVFWSADFTDDTMGRFFKGMQRAVKEKDYRVEFFIQLFDYDHLSECKDIMTSTRFSGIIVSGASEQDTEFLNANKFDLPIVVMNRNEQKYHCVYVNDYEIGKSSARLFSLRNHKTAGLISMNRKRHGATMRQLGYLEACAKHQIEVRPEWIQEAEGRDFVSGYSATQKLLQSKERPTALFVMSPGQVLGTVQACKDAGLSIPEDMEILTYGDNEIFEYFSPTISAIAMPIETLSENALNLLMLVIENGIEMPMGRMLLAGYAFRESCGGFPEGDAESNPSL